MGPAPGVFRADGIITAVTANDGATTCPAVGATTGFILHQSGIPNGSFLLYTGYLPKTPSSGVTSWRGTVLRHNSNGGIHD